MLVVLGGGVAGGGPRRARVDDAGRRCPRSTPPPTRSRSPSPSGSARRRRHAGARRQRRAGRHRRGRRRRATRSPRALEDGLADGTYIVAWRAISADSHPVNGAFTFTVGDGPAASDATDRVAARRRGRRAVADRRLRGPDARLRRHAVRRRRRPVPRHRRRPRRPPPRPARAVRRRRSASSGCSPPCPVQAHLATGLGAGAIFRSGVAGQVLDDGVGLGLALSVVGLAGGGRRPPTARRRPARWCWSPAAPSPSAGFAAAGHTTQTDPVWLTTLVDIVHAAAGGGVVRRPRPARLPPAPPRQRRRRRPRRSSASPGWPTVAVVVIGAAGVTLGWQQVGALDALDVDHLRTPAHRQGGGRRARRRSSAPTTGGASSPPSGPLATTCRAQAALRWTVATEAGALVLAIALTAVLVDRRAGPSRR